MDTYRIAIIGAGRVGTVLAALLSSAGYPITEVMSRTRTSAECLAAKVGAHAIDHAGELTADILLITVSDRAIGSVAHDLALPALAGRIVLHTSGATDISVLDSARRAGLYVGSIHPLFSFGRVDLTQDDISGTYYAIDGDTTAVAAAKTIALALGGIPFTLPADKRTLYHASAVCASNYLVTLLLTAARQLTCCGLTQENALRALLPLAQGTLENLSRAGSQALTGPIARGDTITVDKHLHTLGENTPELLDFYRQLGKLTADIAEENGHLSADAKTIIHQLLRRDIH